MNGVEGWPSRHWVAITAECEDDPDFPGLCLLHEVVHEEGDPLPSTCEHPVVVRRDGRWTCAACPAEFVQRLPR